MISSTAYQTMAQEPNKRISGSQQGQHLVSVNQLGYNTTWPKRFTAPLSPDGSVFSISKKDSKTVLFKGIVNNNIGDFSTFKPLNEKDEYVVNVTGSGLTAGKSYPFSIDQFWLQQQLLKPALDFMIDARSVIGNHPSAYGGTPWRDGTFYSFEVPSLVLQYLSNPNDYEQLPIEINYQEEKRKVTDIGFKYVMEPEGQTALASTRKYFTDLDAPVGDKIPDIIQMIHWGIGYYLINPVTKDPSARENDEDGRRLHPQTLEQFAYFLYGFPKYKQYFSDKFYQQAKDFAFQQWDYTGLFSVYVTVGSAKGRQAPGHSIMPNLMMYEVALRDGDTRADRFMNAAIKQAEWAIKDLDFKLPANTKGQRMSEHKLIPALVYLYTKYPKHAPAKIKAKIDEWVDVALSRSENMWDFRRYDLDKNWSVPEFSETGNIAGLPAIALSAASITDNPEKKRRLEIMATAAIDDLFGRNPQNACSAHKIDLGFNHLEKPWPKGYYPNVTARLELVRGSFSSISPTDMYPYQPNGKFGHLEGWVAFNAAWNLSLAYMNWYDTQLNATIKNDKVHITLISPAGMDKNKVEQVKVNITNPSGQTKELILNESTAKSNIYKQSATLTELQAAPGKEIQISYGNAPFEKMLRIKNTDGKITINN